MVQKGSFLEGLANAVSQIREQVVEEPWYGRVVSERGEAQEPGEARGNEQLPEGLTGEILGPESGSSPQAGSDLRLEHGTVIEGRSQEVPGWGSRVHHAEIAPREREHEMEEPEIG